jgi:predicted dehydrogenase
MDEPVEPLRIGTLGAAKITPTALVRPARERDDAVVVAVAARDRDKAGRFAAKHGIPKVHDSYEALLADPAIEAVYNPLPNGLHGSWTIAALEAGKHVLCEKPFTANAEEAEQVAAAADRTGLVVMEAFHYRYHPLVHRVREILDSGVIGPVRRVETRMVFPLPVPGDIRWNLALAGGSTMDMGCYTVHQLRTLAGAEPTVTSATAKLLSPGIDRWMRAEMSLPDGATGSIETGMLAGRVPVLDARVTGETGRLKVTNLTAPQFFHRLTLTTPERTARERVHGRHTYWYQLAAFVAAVRRGTPVLTPPSDSIANMRVIDAIYRSAGLEPRRPTPVNA